MEYIVAIVAAIYGSTGLWQWFSKRHAKNKDILKAVQGIEGKVATLEDRVEALQDDQERIQAEEARLRVIHFNGELLRNVKHSSEEFDQVLSDIDQYEDYCDDHPKYPNNKALLAIGNIKRVYETCLREHDFL